MNLYLYVLLWISANTNYTLIIVKEHSSAMCQNCFNYYNSMSGLLIDLTYLYLNINDIWWRVLSIYRIWIDFPFTFPSPKDTTAIGKKCRKIFNGSKYVEVKTNKPENKINGNEILWPLYNFLDKNISSGIFSV